jgi:hypothetical protein
VTPSVPIGTRLPCSNAVERPAIIDVDGCVRRDRLHLGPVSEVGSDRNARFGLRRAAWAPGFGVHTERTMNSLGDRTVSCIRKRRMRGKTGINPNTKEP